MNGFFSYNLTFSTEAEAVQSLVAMGLRRVDSLGFAGTTYGDEGEQLITIARKCDACSYTIYEKAARAA